MKASSIAQNINNYISIYGDREIQYMGRIKNADGTTFFENITTISFSATLNGKLMTDDQLRNEPFILLGNSTFTVKQNKIELNWFGKLIRKLVIKNVHS